MSTSKVASIIADRFIAELNKGVAPWARGFVCDSPKNATSGKAYRGINYFLLSMLGVDYAVTFKGAKAMGGSVKKGAKGIPVVFWNWLKPKGDDNAQAVDDVRSIPFMRYYTVFAIDDCEGLTFKRPELPGKDNQKIDSAEALFAKIHTVAGFEIANRGNQPCFIPAVNRVEMPVFEKWEHPVTFYKVLFHECGHALGKVTGKTFANGGEAYATEELVAELFASVCLAHLGLDASGAWDNSVAYVQGWAKRLQDEPQAIISAAQEAQKRFDLIFPPAQAGAEGAEKES